MGEARARSRSRTAILASESRCIYCSAPNDGTVPMSLEHMPPISMFRTRDRPSGMEYASCEPCNVGTKAADTVVSFIARLSRNEVQNDWRLIEAGALRSGVDALAPGLLAELFRPEKSKRKWVWTPSGLLRDHTEILADGPLVRSHMTVFAAKLGMALYREHIGKALPMEGVVYTTCFQNAGLLDKQARTMLSIMPAFGQLRQGRKTSSEQFDYRFNSDHKSILAALVSLHSNVHILIVATADPLRYAHVANAPNMETLRPGQLVQRLLR